MKIDRLRASLYALGMVVIALVAYHTDMHSDEVERWQDLLKETLLFAALLLSFLKTWPLKRNKKTADE